MSHTKPATRASISPPSYPTIISVLVMTVGSIGKVNSDEKLILIGIMGTITIPIIKMLIEIRMPSVPFAKVNIAKKKTIRHPKQLNLIISLKFLRFYIIAPDVNDATRPISTVNPHSIEVCPVPREVCPNIVPITEPNPINDPSIQKNATKHKLKFFTFRAVLRFEQKSTFLASCMATKLGGNSGLALIKKKSGTVMQVIQTF